VLDEYVRIGLETCKKLRISPHIEDLPYQDRQSPGFSDLARVDIWGPVKNHLVILIHGGFWQEGTRKAISPAAVNLVKRGIAAASVGYNYASSANPFLLRIYPKAKSVSLVGHSAGAQMAFKVFSNIRSPRIERLVLIAGIYNLDDLPNCEIGALIGLTPEEAKKNACDASELEGTNVRVLMMAAMKDSPKLIEQNQAMAESLKSKGVAVEYEVRSGSKVNEEITYFTTYPNAFGT
ncbi:unnamed protein product, partial [Haemonchus placei]|uniref:Abhydrolase_3 domain-containing protein n=1 Tax=Haemonchus placei TaxID=6290 RepID=A0A0N4X7S9_HAEPC